MRLIYSKAYSVISWLGSDDNGEMKLVMDTCEFVSSQKNDWERDISWRRDHPSPWKRDTSEGNRAWNAVLKLFTNPYWRRVWIIQEIAVAQNVAVMSGPTLMSYADLLQFFRWVVLLQNTLRESTSVPGDLLPVLARFLTAKSHGFTIIQMLKTNDPSLHTERGTLGTILMATKHQSTDPRDKIFAIQGMLVEVVGLDYNKSARDVYCEFSSKLVAAFPDLRVLGNAGLGYGCVNEFGLPTWVVDL
jgi:hypothetical protein